MPLRLWKQKPHAPPALVFEAHVSQDVTQVATQRLLPAGCKCFSYSELASATNNFSDASVIGEGGFGRVYRGTLPGGLPIAVKLLDRRGLQGDKEFNVEVAMLGRLQHPNIVRLLGACTEGPHRAAVFEYLACGSVRACLDGSSPLSWQSRLSIALDVARGLTHLHEVAQPPLIHRDLTSNNILLGQDGRARIADFGLARALHLPPASTAEQTSNIVTGTFGYVAPEALSKGRVTDAVDRYSFGVVLLELISGQPAVANGQCLADRLRPLLDNVDALQGEVDPRLRAGGGVPATQLAALAEVACGCLQQDPSARPRARIAANMLESILAFQESPRASTSQYNPSPSQPSHDSARTQPPPSLIDELPLASLALSSITPLPSHPASSARAAQPSAAVPPPWPGHALYPTIGAVQPSRTAPSGQASYAEPSRTEPSRLPPGAPAVTQNSGVTPLDPLSRDPGGEPWGVLYPPHPVGLRSAGLTSSGSNGMLSAGWAPAQPSATPMNAAHSTASTIPAGTSGGSAGAVPCWGPSQPGLSPDPPAGLAWGAPPASNPPPSPWGSVPLPHASASYTNSPPAGDSTPVFHSLPQHFSGPSQTLPSETPAGGPGFQSGAQPSTAPTMSPPLPAVSGLAPSGAVPGSSCGDPWTGALFGTEGSLARPPMGSGNMGLPGAVAQGSTGRLPLHLAQMGRSPGQAEDMECPLGAGLRFGVWPDAAAVSPLLASAALGRSVSLPGRQAPAPTQSAPGGIPQTAWGVPQPFDAWAPQNLPRLKDPHGTAAPSAPPLPTASLPAVPSHSRPGPPASNQSSAGMPPAIMSQLPLPQFHSATAAAYPSSANVPPPPGRQVSDSAASLGGYLSVAHPRPSVPSGNPFADGNVPSSGLWGSVAVVERATGMVPDGPRPCSSFSPHWNAAAGQASSDPGVCLKCSRALRAWEAKPCGHLIACQACALALEAAKDPCPVCHARIKGLVCHPVPSRPLPTPS